MLSSNSARQPSRVSCISNSCSCVRINNSRTHTTCLTHESTEAQTQTQSHAYANTPSQKGKTRAHDLDPESVAVGTEDQNASAQQSSSSLSATKPESSVVPESGPGISSTHATGQHSESLQEMSISASLAVPSDKSHEIHRLRQHLAGRYPSIHFAPDL